MNLTETNLTGALLDALPLAAIVTDHLGRIFIFNPAAEAMLGWSAVETMTLPFLELWASPPEARRILTQAQDMPEGQPNLPSMVTFRHRDGSEVPGRLTLTILTDQVGEPVGHLAIFEDYRKELTQTRQLSDAVEQLWEAEKRVAGLSRMNALLHALNQPLTAAVGSLEILQDEQVPAPVRARLDKLQAQMERLRLGLADMARLLHAPPSQHRRYP